MRFTILKSSWLILSVVFLTTGCSDDKIVVSGNIEEPFRLGKTDIFREKLESYITSFDYIFFESSDDQGILLNRESFRHADVVYRDNWQIITDVLPAPAKLKNIKSINILTGKGDYDLYHLSGTGLVSHTNFFYYIMDAHRYRGSAVKNNYFVKLYDKYREPQLELKADSMLVVFKNNQRKVFCSDFLRENIRVASSGFFLDNEDIAVIWENYPENQIHEIFYRMKESLKSGKVLALFIDGVGYHFLNHARLMGKAGFFQEVSFKPLIVTYPPRTVNSYYSIGTGEYNNTREPSKSPRDFFSDFLSTGKKGVVLENNPVFFSTELDLVMHNPDINNHVDFYIYESAKQKIEAGYDFVFVHFHSVDDYGHNYGPYSEKTLQVLEKVSRYSQTLIDMFSGTVFIFSDHGMHYTKDKQSLINRKGDHYTGKPEDIIGVFSHFITE